MRYILVWCVFLIAALPVAQAAENPSTLQCTEVMTSIASSCEGDHDVTAAVSANCNAISDEEKKYIALVLKCAKAGGTVNRAGGRDARGGQAPANADTSSLLEQNRGLLEKCGTDMGAISAAFEAASRGLVPKVANPGGSEKCQAKAKQVFEQLKQRADADAAKATAKAGEYGGAGTAVAMIRDDTKDNADKLGGDRGKAGDQSKAGDNKGSGAGGGGGGMPDPSSLMKAIADQKAKQDADKAKAEAERKAQEAREKAMRVQQCTNNEINRNNAIGKCKADFPVDPRYPTVQTVKKDQEDCIANVAATHGPVVANCQAIP